jgi:dephospho-CoA kinase
VSVPRKPVLGLVGAIGGGKSAAAAILARKGGLVIDADVLGHEALELPEVKAGVERRWGPGVMKPDGSVNRRALAGVVFAHEAERKGLETMVFPAIARGALRRIDEGRADPAVSFVVLDAAVMIEAGWKHLADRLLYLDAPRDVRVKRVAERGWTEADLTAREAAQMPADEKKRLCDAVLNNDGSLSALEAALDVTLAAWGIATTPKDATCRTM